MKNASLNDFKTLSYPVRLEYDEADELFVASFPDLPGCSATGHTPAEAYENAQEGKIEWLQVALDQGLPIPKPTTPTDYSGRLLVRMPTSLHQLLADKAHEHGTSLNQYVVHLLSAAAVGDEFASRLERLMDWAADIDWRLAELAADVKHVRTYTAHADLRTTTALLPSSQTTNLVFGTCSFDPVAQTREWTWETPLSPSHGLVGAFKKKQALPGTGRVR